MREASKMSVENFILQEKTIFISLQPELKFFHLAATNQPKPRLDKRI
jgi:hypothetical protein